MCHFTAARNFPSILKHGLISRIDLVDQNIDFTPSDPYRLDDALDAVSLSIEKVNSPMFEGKQRELGGEWIILGISVSVLWTHHCKFCWRNAASREIRRHSGRLNGPWAFNRMFEDEFTDPIDPRSDRDRYNIPYSQPTDEQAEVQVLEPISADLIFAVAGRTQFIQRRLSSIAEKAGAQISVTAQPNIFLP